MEIIKGSVWYLPLILDIVGCTLRDMPLNPQTNQPTKSEHLPVYIIYEPRLRFRGPQTQQTAAFAQSSHFVSRAETPVPRSAGGAEGARSKWSVSRVEERNIKA